MAISREQVAARLRIVADMRRQNANAALTADALGMTRGGMQSFLIRHAKCHGWPPSLAALESALADADGAHAPSAAPKLPDFLTPGQREWLDRIAPIAATMPAMADAKVELDLTEQALRRQVKKLTGSAAWPPMLSPALWDLPILRSGPHQRKAQCQYISAADLGDDRGNRMSADEIAARRDQVTARRRRHELAQLEAERTRYNLPRTARPISEMPV